MAFMSPEDIAALLHAEGSGLSPDDYDEATQPAGSRERRAELLGPVLSACQQAWFSGSEQIDAIAEKLGDGSRDVAWRGPFGDSGILEFFLGALAIDGLRQGLIVHSLRLVGNSCADTDENRARLVNGNHMASVIRHLQDESLIPFSVPVLFNILVDYEPAQRLASQCHLNQHLTQLLASPNLPNYSPFITYFCKILCLLAGQEGEATYANPLTVFIVLTLASSPTFKDDLDDFLSLVSVAATYLIMESFQTSLVTGPNMNLFLTVFYIAHANFQPEHVDDPDVSVLLRQQRTALLNSLADLTGHDSFFAYHPMNSHVTQNIWAWLHAPEPQLQTAACIALGNMSRSDDVSVALVQTHKAHAPLTNLISDPAVTDPQLLHSALSFLKNLAIPSQNKPLLGAFLEPSCIPRIFSLDAMPQVQFAAVSLARLLLVNCAPNVRRFCAPLSADPSSPAHSRTSVHALIALFERSDADPTRLEAARAVAAICRVLHSTPVLPVLPDWDPFNDAYIFEAEEPQPPQPAAGGSPEDSDGSQRRELFYKKHDHLGQVLALLVTQQKWPIIRSEAWFVFALMCRSPDGSYVIHHLLPIHSTVDALFEAVTGKRTAILETSAIAGGGETTSASPEQRESEASFVPNGLDLEPQQVDAGQQANMVRVDRENALVLCTELLRNWGDKMPQLRYSLLQDLVKEGTELVAAEKAQR